MKFTCGLTFKLPLLLVLLLVVATKGHTVLQCYSCDNCEKVDKTTRLEQCGGENFSTTTTTSTTSMAPSESTTTSSSENFSTTTMRSTPRFPSDSTVKPSTAEDPTTINKTVVELTTPINGFTSTTISPPITSIISDTKNATSNESSLTTFPSFFVTPSSEGRAFISEETGLPSQESGNFTDQSHNRQRRHTEFNGITYYCYKIQKKYDNVFGTKRGCIGVKTGRPVCDELDSSNNNQTNKCSACTNTLCNGSSAIGASIVTTLLVALLALIYKV